MFTTVRMKKLLAVVIKDHIGKVMAALEETGACHLIEKVNAKNGKNRAVASSIDNCIDEVLMRKRYRMPEVPGVQVSSDADLMLSDIAKETAENCFPVMHRAMDIKKKVHPLKSIYSLLEKCEETHYTYILEAWVPAGKEELIRAYIYDAASGKCVVDFYEPESSEMPPTMLSNPQIMKPFETLVKRYGFPSYYEIDPTCVMFITFPIIFGLMYGDVGHGIVLFLLSTLILFSGKRLKMLESLKEFTPILTTCALYSVFFGFIYGEFLGMRFNPIWMNPADNIVFFLMFSVYIGVAHMALGFLLSAINHYANKRYLRMIFQILWVLFSFSSVTFYIYLPMYDYTTFIDGFFKLIFLPGIFMVAIGIMINSEERKGSLSGVAVPFYLGLKYALNLISYMRLVIMALAHSTISATIIYVCLALGGKIVQFVVVGGFITFFLIIIVETFVVFIQSLRLHWVEWFYVFYMGRGMEFSPIKLS